MAVRSASHGSPVGEHALHRGRLHEYLRSSPTAPDPSSQSFSRRRGRAPDVLSDRELSGAARIWSYRGSLAPTRAAHRGPVGGGIDPLTRGTRVQHPDARPDPRRRRPRRRGVSSARRRARASPGRRSPGSDDVGAHHRWVSRVLPGAAAVRAVCRALRTPLDPAVHAPGPHRAGDLPPAGAAHRAARRPRRSRRLRRPASLPEAAGAAVLGRGDPDARGAELLDLHAGHADSAGYVRHRGGPGHGALPVRQQRWRISRRSARRQVGSAQRHHLVARTRGALPGVRAHATGMDVRRHRLLRRLPAPVDAPRQRHVCPDDCPDQRRHRVFFDDGLRLGNRRDQRAVRGYACRPHRDRAHSCGYGLPAIAGGHLCDAAAFRQVWARAVPRGQRGTRRDDSGDVAP